MALRTLLIGPSGYGGEGVYVDALQRHPPTGVTYDVSGDFHRSASGARCLLPAEVLLNKLVRPRTIPDIGFRALQLREHYDLVHAHAHPVLLLGRGGTPIVMSEGSSAAVYLGDYLGWGPERIRSNFATSRRIYRLLRIHDRLLAMDRAACVYVFSNWARDINIRWGADPAKLQVIYPGFEAQDKVDRAGRDAFTFLFVGTDFERKGGYDVVEAFAMIRHDLPHIQLVIAGSDPGRPNPDRFVHSWVPAERRQRLADLLSALQQERRAVRMKTVSPTLLHTELFPHADAFVMPTNAEGFGFTNVEAMTFGLPVITSTAGPASEIVTDGETGRLVTPGDVPGLADAMHALATAPGLAAEMGAAGRRRFEQRFARERFRQELGGLYGRVVRTA